MKNFIKLLLIFFITFLVLGLSLSSVFAQDNMNLVGSETVEAGILPDSTFYFLKAWAEKIQETFTLRTEAKLQLMEKLGEKRAAEAEKLIEKGKTDLAEKLLEKYNQRLEKMKNLIDKKGEKLDEKLDDAQARIKRRFEKRNEVLHRVSEKAPEKAKPGLLRALDNSEKQLENLKARIENQIKIREEKNKRLRERLGNLNANGNENENENTNEND